MEGPICLEVNRTFEQFYQNISQIWKSMGFDIETRNNREKRIVMHIEELFNEMLEEEREHRDIVKDHIEELVIGIHHLSTDLELEPFQPDLNLSYFDLEKDLWIKTMDLNKLKIEKCRTFQDLKAEEKSLCSFIGFPEYTSMRSIPCNRDILVVKENIEMMKNVKHSRKVKLIEIRRTIRALVDQLPEIPITEFLRQVLNSELDEFPLTEENMKRVRKLHQNMKSLFQNKILFYKKYFQKIKGARNRFEVAMRFQKEFSETFERCICQSTLDSMKKLANLETDALRTIPFRTSELCDPYFNGHVQASAIMDSSETSEETSKVSTENSFSVEFEIKHEHKVESSMQCLEEQDLLLGKCEQWANVFKNMIQFADQHIILNTTGSEDLY